MVNKKNIDGNSRAKILSEKYSLSILELALELKNNIRGMMKDEKRRCNEISQ